MYEISGATTYRIMLAVSIALLIHTLMGLLLENYRLPRPQPQKTIQFELVRSGDQPTKTQASNASKAAPESAPSTNTTLSHRPAVEKPKVQAPQKAVVTTQSSVPRQAAPSRSEASKPRQQAQAVAPKAAGSKAKTHTQTRPTKSRASEASALSSASKPAKAGTHTLPSDQGKSSGITELNTHRDRPLSTYERILWEHIAQRIRFAPFMQSLQQVRRVRLQLDLMSNGTLEAVRVIHTSGDPTVDAAAKHATLLASPYPPPPADRAADGYRFQVELEFTPAQNS